MHDCRIEFHAQHRRPFQPWVAALPATCPGRVAVAGGPARFGIPAEFTLLPAKQIMRALVSP